MGATLGSSFLSWSKSSISYWGGSLFAYFLRRSVDESESVESDSLDEEEEGAHRFRDTFFFFLSLSIPESVETLSRRSVEVKLIRIWSSRKNVFQNKIIFGVSGWMEANDHLVMLYPCMCCQWRR